MKIKELKILIDEWIAAGDWDEAEIELYSSRDLLLMSLLVLSALLIWL